jgi:phosphoglycerate dehydrogenase-like enzyme
MTVESTSLADNRRKKTSAQQQGSIVMKIGFIGLGHMGAGMAANLLKAGHEVSVYNRRNP